MIEIICSGIGGQGVLVAGMVLADIAMEDGKNVSWYPSYGFEMRGGAANCEVKIGDEDLQSPYCYEPDILRKCSVAPLSLHIQDNDGSGDGHLIPGDGTIDWDLFLAVLKEIGYLGDCVLEAHHQSLEAPDAERDAILARLMETAKTMRDRMRFD